MLDLFAGTRSIGKAFEARGHEVYSIEWDERHEDIDWYADMFDVTAEEIIKRFGKPDIIWASPPCFTGETIVLTDKGFKRIDNIRVGDKVITHTNSYRTVTDIGRKKVNNIRVVKTTASFNIHTTDNHPFYVRKNYRQWNHSKRGWDRIIEDPEWIQAKDLEKNWLVGYAINKKSIIPKWEGSKNRVVNHVGKHKDRAVNNLQDLMDNKDFWWIVGRYMGDGSYRYNPEKSRYDISISCEHDEVSEITSVLDRIKAFNYNIHRGETATKVYVHKKELVEFVMQFGRYAHGKKLNNTIIDLPKHLLKGFLEGYFSADGSLSTSSIGTKTQAATSVSKELLYGIGQCVTKAYEKPFSLAMYERPDKCIIEGREVNQRNAWTLSFVLNPKKAHSFIEDGILWSPIKELSNEDREEWVYNMTVEEDNSYTANGSIVHNCEKFSVAAIGKHWHKGTNDPKTEETKEALRLLEHTVQLIKDLDPKYYFIENPRGKMRKVDVMQDLPRYTVSYCQYGDTRMKPTDLWTNHPEPKFKPACKNGDPCHVAAPRGSQTGTQGIKGAVLRSVIPKELCEHVVLISEESYTEDKEIK